MIKTWINRLLGKENPIENAQTDDVIYGDFDAESVIETILTRLQTRWEKSAAGFSNETEYTFGFQNGHYHAYVRKDRYSVRLTYLFFYEAPAGELRNVHAAINIVNQRYPEYKVIYSSYEKTHSLHIHIQTFINLTNWCETLEDEFANMLVGVFDVSRNFRSVLEGINSKDATNLEEKTVFDDRENYLLHETHMRSQRGEWRAYDTHHLLLPDLLRSVFEDHDMTFHRLAVVTDTLETIEDDETIRNFDLTYLLVDKDSVVEDEESELRFSRLQASLILTANIGDLPEQTWLFHFAADTEAEGVLYMRVTVVQPDRELRPQHPLLSKDEANQRALTFLMSFSRNPDNRRDYAFDYHYDELMQKIANGEVLEGEDEFVASALHRDTAYDLYWGRRFFLSERYYEALLHLENAYENQRKDFHGMTSSERKVFYEICYYLGICYSQLGLPKKAYYYLDGLFNINNVRYTTAYINALVSAKDHRALDVLNRLITNLQNVLKDQERDLSDEQKGHLTDFIFFLRRSRCHVRIDYGDLDEAENELRELLVDCPKSDEKALFEQLAFITHLRDIHDATSSTADFE